MQTRDGSISQNYQVSETSGCWLDLRTYVVSKLCLDEGKATLGRAIDLWRGKRAESNTWSFCSWNVNQVKCATAELFIRQNYSVQMHRKYIEQPELESWLDSGAQTQMVPVFANSVLSLAQCGWRKRNSNFHSRESAAVGSGPSAQETATRKSCVANENH